MPLDPTIFSPDAVTRWDSLIVAAAARHGIPAALLRAIVAQESAGNPNAWRDEPTISAPQYGIYGDASYGLVQILLSTARDMGFKGRIAELLDPAVNLDLGAKYLAHLAGRFGGSVQDTISAYNQGGPYKDGTGAYRNQRYVDSVLRRITSAPAGGGGAKPRGGLLAAAVIGGAVLWLSTRRGRK